MKRLNGLNRRALRIARRLLPISLVVLVAFGLGYLVRWGCAPAPVEPAGADAGQPATSSAPAKATVWTCSMHPQIRQPEPGNCPICGMKLVPAEAGVALGPRVFTTSEAAKALMDIETVPVERRFVTATVRMVGKIDYDETRLAYITAWVPGRLDRLFVDYTGIAVREGDHMVELYSPDLLVTQGELLEWARAVKGLKESDVLRESTLASLAAAREKLRLWGLTQQQIADIEKRGKATDRMTIYAPRGGIVIHKHAQQGMYVNTGTRIYTIADLSGVWVKLSAYESDLIWLRYGQKVQFASISHPGQTFEGTISFIDPVLDPKTRTVKVRVNASNADGRLKPEMFVKAEVSAQVAAGGRVMDPALAGKWISPMHPEIVKDASGTCDVCGMPLVRAESLGYVSADPAEADKPLVIPVSAALVTGRRAVVYVEVPGADRPTYEGREIALGPRAGEHYIVREGLREGERVVVRGNFKIDSALQIQAKPSMMSPERAPAAPARDSPARPGAAVPEEFREQLGKVFDAYFAMQRALAADNAEAAIAAAAQAGKALGALDGKLLDAGERDWWAKASAALGKVLSGAAGSKGIEKLREAFAPLSEQMAVLARRSGPPGGSSLYQMKCPMAFDRCGASWLQLDRAVRNPYFGSTMPRCGEVVEVIAARQPADRGSRLP